MTANISELAVLTAVICELVKWCVTDNLYVGGFGGGCFCVCCAVRCFARR